MRKTIFFSKKSWAVCLCILLLLTATACTVVKSEIPVSNPLNDSSDTTFDPALTSENQTDGVDSLLDINANAYMEKMLSNMTLHDKICQLLIVEPEDLSDISPVTSVDNTTTKMIQDMPVGGILYSKQNLISKEQVREMLAFLQDNSPIPLLLTCDEEGGRVNRLMDTVGTTYIGPMLSYKDQGEMVAYNNAYTIASDMYALGFNVDMAPVADVWSNPSNTVIGDRAYSNDFQQAASLVKAAVNGFHAGGVGTALKHFPGHGDTSADSHFGAVYISKTLDEIRSNELIPFQAGIEAGSDMVMMGHLILSDIDEQPAPFSYKIVTELLREQLGFDGVITTDGLKMEAMTDYYNSGEIACKAIAAGVDMLLCPENPQKAVTALESAVAEGAISEQRIDESVRRIITMKVRRGIIGKSVYDMINTVSSYESGTAGSSLKLYQSAFQVLNFAEEYDDSQQELTVFAIDEYLSTLNKEEIKAVESTLESIDKIASDVFSEGLFPLKDILAEAGNPHRYDAYRQGNYEKVSLLLKTVLKHRLE